MGGVPDSRGEGKGTLEGVNSLIMRAPELKLACQKVRDSSHLPRVVESHSEGLGLTQQRENTPQVAKRSECRAQGEPKINGLLACVALLWQVREGAECLLEVSHSFAVGRPGHGLLPGLSAV